MICSILVAQNAVWENPKPFVLGDNIEIQQPTIKTSDGNTIFFWSKTELDGRIMYATKLNEIGEFQWSEEKKIICEYEPALVLIDVKQINDNCYVLRFGHVEYKQGPYNMLYNIMDENGNMLWAECFNILDYNEDLLPGFYFRDSNSGFNLICYNEDNTETKILHFNLDGTVIEIDVTGYTYANRNPYEIVNLNNFYYLLYNVAGELYLSKLNIDFEPINTAIIDLNVLIYGNDTIHFYPYNNEFLVYLCIDGIACKISESGELIWSTNVNASFSDTKSGITGNGDLIVIDKYLNDFINYSMINNNGVIEVEQTILQGEEIYNHNFHVSYNGIDEINVIVGSYNNSTFTFAAQTIDLYGNMTYPIDGLPLGIYPEYLNLVLTSYTDTFSYLSLETTAEFNTDLRISTYNDYGNQIIPEDQMILESSFVSRTWYACSNYIEDENCAMIAYVSNRGEYWNGEVYLQKINQFGELVYEEESRLLNVYESHEDITDVIIDNEGYVFIVYEISDYYDYLKCDVFDRLGNFIQTYELDNGDIGYYTVHHITDEGVIIGWEKNDCYAKILKLDQNNILWANPITKYFPGVHGVSIYITDNYLYCRHFDSPWYARYLYRFEEDGSTSPGWLNGFNLNSIENLISISSYQQANDCFYFLGQISEEEFQLLAVNDQQQVFLDDLNITIPYYSGSFDLYADDNIYLASADTLQQQINVQKYDFSGQLIWDNNIIYLDPNERNGMVFKSSSANSISLVSTESQNFRLASCDLDGNVVTPLYGSTITDSRGEKRLIGAHEMDNGQFLVIWRDQCVENILDGDVIQYNAICGQLFDFSSLGSNENTIQSSYSYQLSNYPNPFNPETTISFSIPNESEIELSVYNIKGQKVKVILKDNFEKGNHSIVWNGIDESNNHVSTGIYYYKLKVNGKAEAVEKCLLLK